MDESDILDEKVVSELKGLMGDEYVTVYEAFLRSGQQNIQELNQAVEQDDIKKIETISHALKGSTANIGALHLSEVCRQMLEDARKSVSDKFAEYLESINYEYARLNATINELIRQ